MAAKVYLSEDGYSIRGGEPPSLARQSDGVRLMYWGWVMNLALGAKDRDLARGLDKDGKPLKEISTETRLHRRSAMTPTGKGSPSAPPLTPGRQKSRTRSLLTGRAYPDRAEFWWKFDPHIGDSWARILEDQREKGRDVFGLSPQSLRRVVAQAWERYARWEAGKPVEMPAVIGVAQAQPIVAVGRTDSRYATFGIGAASMPAQSSGGMRIEDWFKHFRRPARVEIPARTTTNHNRLLGHIWGNQGAPPVQTARARPPAPKPRPKPIVTPAATPTPSATSPSRKAPDRSMKARDLADARARLRAAIRAKELGVRAGPDERGVLLDAVDAAMRRVAELRGKVKPDDRPAPPPGELLAVAMGHLDSLMGAKYPDAKLIPVHELRAEVEASHGPLAASHAALDRVLRHGRFDEGYRLIAITDYRDMTQRELDRSIPGLNEILGYLEVSARRLLSGDEGE
jgi:hypothetical protein